MRPFSRRGFVRMAGAACFAGTRASSAPDEHPGSGCLPHPTWTCGQGQQGRGAGYCPGAGAEARLQQLPDELRRRKALDNAQPLKRAIAEQGVKVTAVMELGRGPKVWDFYHGPLTVGLIPAATRQGARRCSEASGGRSPSRRCGVDSYSLRIYP